MANTYTLIASNTLGASTASVTFSAIPSTYTDLVLRMSVRTTSTGVQDTFALQFNSTTANYSINYLEGTGSSASAGGFFNATTRTDINVTGNGATADTFSNIELYIPSYLASQHKPSSVFSVNENNATAAVMQVTANLWRDTAAINTIKLDALTYSGYNFVSGSSFFLYGIKNS